MKASASPVIIAAALTGLLAIPFAAEAGIDRKPLEITSNSSVPSEISTVKGPGRYQKTVETPAGLFKTRSTDDKTVQIVETPNSKLKAVSTPEKEVNTLETPEGLYRVKKTSGEKMVVCDCPRGGLNTTWSDGAKHTDFRGRNRTLLEEKRERLRQRYREKMSQVEQRLREASGVYKEEFAMEIHEESPEWIELENTGKEAVDLEGWTISDEDDTEELPSITLEPGETVNLTKQEGENSIPDITWNNAGDTAFLRDSDGNLIEKKAYS